MDIDGNLILGTSTLVEDVKRIQTTLTKDSPNEFHNEKIDEIFLKWLFKYHQIDFIPFSNDGLNVFKSIFQTISEEKLKEIFNSDVFFNEIENLTTRKNEISKRDIRLISKFLKTIFEFIITDFDGNNKSFWDNKETRDHQMFRKCKKPSQSRRDKKR